LVSFAALGSGCQPQASTSLEEGDEPPAPEVTRDPEFGEGALDGAQALAEENAARRAQLASSAAIALRDYYTAIDEQQFDEAWARLTVEQRAAFGGEITAWQAGYDDTLEHSIEVLSGQGYVQGSRATVSYAITAVDSNTCESEFRSTARMRKAQGRWLIERLEGRAVGEPLCPEPEEPAPAEEPDELYLQDAEPIEEDSGGGGCHSSYSGCVPDEGFDVDCGELSDSDIEVYGDDEYGLDADGDGIGCES